MTVSPIREHHRPNTFEPWARQPNETPEAWQAFETYRDAEGKRRVAGVGEQLGKSTTLMERWSARWSWVDRAAAWDAEQDREWTREILRQRRIVGRRHLDTAQLLIDKAMARLETLDINTLTPRELVEFVKAGMDIETRIYGLDAVAGEQRPVQIVLDSRLLPPGAQLPGD